MRDVREYRITTMADMLSVPAEKWDEMLLDLKTWLELAEAGSFEVEIDGESVSVAIDPVFIWVDDGLRDVQRIYLGDDRYDLQGEQE